MVRLLVCGDIHGQFSALVKRVNTLHTSKAGPFDVVLVSGTFFGEGCTNTHLNTLKQLPIPLYFTDWRNAPDDVTQPKPGEVCMRMCVCVSVCMCGDGLHLMCNNVYAYVNMCVYVMACV